jgi:hypothetical protein
MDTTQTQPMLSMNRSGVNPNRMQVQDEQLENRGCCFGFCPRPRQRTQPTH